MKRSWMTLIGLCLLLVGCTQGGYLATSPTETAPAVITATTTLEERSSTSLTTTGVSSTVQETVDVTTTITQTAALVQYRNANSYQAEPQFEVRYDPAVWSFDQAMTSNDRLLHRTIENCDFRLQAGPVGAASVDKAQLANREWTISLVQPNILLYWFSYQTIGFTFGLVLPTDYSATEKTACQIQAEQVIDTFRIIE